MENKKTFEDKQARLAEIVDQLDKDKSLTLDQTAKIYAEGKKLIKELTKELNTLKDTVSKEIVLEK